MDTQREHVRDLRGEWHLTRVAGWMLNTLGFALGVGLAIAFAAGIVAGVTGNAIWLPVGGLIASAAFAAILYTASAPMPDED